MILTNILIALLSLLNLHPLSPPLPSPTPDSHSQSQLSPSTRELSFSTLEGFPFISHKIRSALPSCVCVGGGGLTRSVVQGGLELLIQPRLNLNTQWSSCLILSAGIGVLSSCPVFCLVLHLPSGWFRSPTSPEFPHLLAPKLLNYLCLITGPSKHPTEDQDLKQQKGQALRKGFSSRPP